MAASEVYELTVTFETRGATGVVSAQVWPNRDPGTVGADPSAHGFPVCQATISADLAGYNALLGWVQVVGVDSPAGAGRHFEPDPLQIFEDLNTPFGFYGLHPTLFDAPSRRDKSQPLDWLAHSFLCVSPGSPMERRVQPVTAFQWGFRLTGGRIVIVGPSDLPVGAWDDHTDILGAAYPGWLFEAAP